MIYCTSLRVFKLDQSWSHHPVKISIGVKLVEMRAYYFFVLYEFILIY